jgi:hypothetical protein
VGIIFSAHMKAPVTAMQAMNTTHESTRYSYAPGSATTHESASYSYAGNEHHGPQIKRRQ